MKINDVTVDAQGWATPQLAAVHELLRQRACELGFLQDDASAEDVERGVERTLQQDVAVPEPSEEECRRWYDANTTRYRSGDLVHVRHILLQVTPGVSVPALRAFGESMLNEIRRHPDVFAERAARNSNCPSGAQGGNLGQLQRGQTVPEFEKAIFGSSRIGVLPELIRTRYGFHIVSVDERIEGEQLPYEAVRSRIADELRKHSEERALSQYVRVLAARAELSGVELEAASSPLVQ